MSSKIDEIIKYDSKNQICIDCEDKNITHVSINNGIFLCSKCAEKHKVYGNQISYIKSIYDMFDSYLLSFLQKGGNRNFKNKLEEYGVDLKMLRLKLYKTKGADYYRRRLHAKVKGEPKPQKDFKNANEISVIDSHIFPEFDNYIVGEGKIKDEMNKCGFENVNNGESNNNDIDIVDVNKLEQNYEEKSNGNNGEQMDFNIDISSDTNSNPPNVINKLNKENKINSNGISNSNIDPTQIEIHQEKEIYEPKKTTEHHKKGLWGAMKKVGGFLKKESKVAYKGMKSGAKFVAKKTKIAASEVGHYIKKKKNGGVSGSKDDPKENK